MIHKRITLVEAEVGDFSSFKSELQTAFAVAVVDEFGQLPDGPIPSDTDLDAAMGAPDAVVLRIQFDHQPIGGAILSINEETKHNSLGLFFLSPKKHGRGLGYLAWQAIERRYPETLVWHTHTPYFEKRNIHFYVNKCGFKIVEFFNDRHLDPHGPSSSEFPGADEGFRFEKIMKG
ncbi:acetyltransferase [Rhodomicrobium udaipurense JA643]|uniref:GNAT family N-acetyltransferase n=1 Tax=Rhodomicrobium udaipurense TaxID=1202716 RepID=A0A8I1GBZ9_9HYPH|nr:GNAT family N-acetyltransferase [Rhodomicrobium udaipurense]KAI94482.1 acetyltransferase [Rhodomicrobium udaipurense JA643]MBJ7544293.1 GNAT family N-acetyltransferase [Rhodomicrobium udaipurense]